MVNKRLSAEAPPDRGGGGDALAPEKNEGNGRSSSEGEIAERANKSREKKII